MFDDILVPTDGSDDADVAVDYGIELEKGTMRPSVFSTLSTLLHWVG